MKIISGLLVIGLALAFIVNSYYSPSNNRISALTEEAAFTNDQAVVEGDHFSYYSSIFSNLTRGLPIDEGISGAESLNE
jgi:hypothetical protein